MALAGFSMFLSTPWVRFSGSGGLGEGRDRDLGGVVGLAGAEHGEDDVAASSGQADESGVVAFAIGFVDAALAPRLGKVAERKEFLGRHCEHVGEGGELGAERQGFVVGWDHRCYNGAMEGDGVGQETQQLITRGTRLMTWLTAVAGAWFLCFVGGGAWLVYRSFHSAGFSCTPGVSSCAAHDPGLAGPIALVIVGFVGFFVTGIVASIVSVRYLGRGATAFLRTRRTPSFPMSSPPPFPGEPPPGSPPWPGAMPPGPPPGG